MTPTVSGSGGRFGFFLKSTVVLCSCTRSLRILRRQRKRPKKSFFATGDMSIRTICCITPRAAARSFPRAHKDTRRRLRWLGRVESCAIGHATSASRPNDDAEASPMIASDDAPRSRRTSMWK